MEQTANCGESAEYPESYTDEDGYRWIRRSLSLQVPADVMVSSRLYCRRGPNGQNIPSGSDVYYRFAVDDKAFEALLAATREHPPLPGQPWERRTPPRRASLWGGDIVWPNDARVEDIQRCAAANKGCRVYRAADLALEPWRLSKKGNRFFKSGRHVFVAWEPRWEEDGWRLWHKKPSGEECVGPKSYDSFEALQQGVVALLTGRPAAHPEGQ